MLSLGIFYNHPLFYCIMFACLFLDTKVFLSVDTQSQEVVTTIVTEDGKHFMQQRQVAGRSNRSSFIVDNHRRAGNHVLPQPHFHLHLQSDLKQLLRVGLDIFFSHHAQCNQCHTKRMITAFSPRMYSYTLVHNRREKRHARTRPSTLANVCFITPNWLIGQVELAEKNGRSH